MKYEFLIIYDAGGTHPYSKTIVFKEDDLFPYFICGIRYPKQSTIIEKIKSESVCLSSYIAIMSIIPIPEGWGDS